jgi:hypothetical protein
MYRFMCLLVLCGAALGFQGGIGSTEREKDIYSIYSLLMANPKTSHGADNNPRYLIADRTRPPLPKLPCVRAPADRDTEFQEVLSDFETRKASPALLTRQLSISKPYELLPSEEVEAFHRGYSDPRFEGVTDVFTFADVYFSRNGNLALTGISTWCGRLCGLYKWKVLERLPSGEWKEQPWSTCSVIAQGKWNQQLSFMQSAKVVNFAALPQGL